MVENDKRSTPFHPRVKRLPLDKGRPDFTGGNAANAYYFGQSVPEKPKTHGDEKNNVFLFAIFSARREGLSRSH